jgi:hypothetical protein
MNPLRAAKQNFEFGQRSAIIWLAMIYVNGLAQAMLCIGSRGSIRAFPYRIPPAAHLG